MARKFANQPAIVQFQSRTRWSSPATPGAGHRGRRRRSRHHPCGVPGRGDLFPCRCPRTRPTHPSSQKPVPVVRMKSYRQYTRLVGQGVPDPAGQAAEVVPLPAAQVTGATVEQFAKPPDLSVVPGLVREVDVAARNYPAFQPASLRGRLWPVQRHPPGQY